MKNTVVTVDWLDENLNKLDNFIEIEYDEKKAETMSGAECLQELREWEKELTSLGIRKKHRLTDSLFERYKGSI